MSTCEAKQLILMYLFKNNMIGSNKLKKFDKTNKNSYYFFGCHLFFHHPGITNRGRFQHSKRIFVPTRSLSHLHQYYYTKQQTSHWNSKQWASLDWYWNSRFWQSKQPSFTLSSRKDSVLSTVLLIAEWNRDF